MAEREPSSLRLIATLAGAGLLSGLVLVAVFVATEPMIRENKARALAAAIVRVLPGTERSVALVERDGRLQPWRDAAVDPPAGGTVHAGLRPDGSLVGFAIPADGPGYMDTIGLLFGYDPQRTAIVGMEVLESRETPGLGDKIITDDRFLANFVALAVEPRIEPVKRGEKIAPHQVDCITGATISSESVVAILNAGSERWRPLLDAAAADSALFDEAGDE